MIKELFIKPELAVVELDDEVILASGGSNCKYDSCPVPFACESDYDCGGFCYKYNPGCDMEGHPCPSETGGDCESIWYES